ncbi:MAG: hypothetical protein KKE77_12855 [Alphaproteobacteria bacterium]|uniref:Uncharacterized protein n=1 Tax=viral metagenome TaxID=1070528 RepID=A0A6H1ZNI8_9ZZZZ|nr:hypothetical protein [Alphaproteobacteria bacterium]MBU2342120.1 hypothetical protein [Alphaproteobacteria bacterium]
MKELGLLLASALLMACGFVASWGAQDLRYADRRIAFTVIAADNSELRKTAKTLRSRCPVRPRLQASIPFAPGEPI